MRFLTFFSVITAVLLSGCLEIPPQETLSTNEGTRLVDHCPEVVPAIRQQGGDLKTTFRITSWNMNKFQRAGWQQELNAWAKRSDLLLLQEAMERPALHQLLQQSHFNWLQLQAFRLEGEATGVVNAAPAAALYNCSLREPEPVSRLPKSTLLTLYPLDGSSYPLLVVNVHGVNFELGMAAYRRQMTRLFHLAKRYPGPTVLAGDFAAWGNKRSHYLLKLAQQSGFDEVIPVPDLRLRVLSEPVDHIFYRKLNLQQSESKSTHTSDHNPLWAEFSVVKNPVR